jgi:hypothetical protein
MSGVHKGNCDVTCRFMNVSMSGAHEGNWDVTCGLMNVSISGASKGNCDVTCRFMNIRMSGAHKSNCDVTCPLTPCGGGLEYLHRSPCESQEATEGNTVSDEAVKYGWALMT